MNVDEESIIQEAKRRWNEEADQYNQWSELGQDEIDEQIQLTKALRKQRDG